MLLPAPLTAAAGAEQSLGRENAAPSAEAAVARGKVTPQVDAHKETLRHLRIDSNERFY
jgi:hypothetical protein